MEEGEKIRNDRDGLMQINEEMYDQDTGSDLA